MVFEGKHKEFIIIKVNLNIIRKDDEQYPYNEDNFYFEFNNIGYNNIVWMNCIYNYCVFYLGFKTIYNFFFKAMFKPMRKAYKEEETRY